MAESDEWFIYIEDRDRKQFSLAGPITGRFVDDWIEKIVVEQDSGRDLACQEFTSKQMPECRVHAKSRGLSEVDSAQLITTPKDKSNDYLGKLPDYASKADRAKVVQLLCKGKCGRGRWAELNKIYPGKVALRKALMGEYKATCLRCGGTSLDNYNWYR
ncbi:hypothetical protein ACPF7Z_06370 [Halomonas sp. GXIMD04776]|uniref:hypothetical protein n=1 Tax=Halomonas sp. GXIMD04776 TaxID=3415605 RepID=UPI003CC1D7B6